MILDNILNRLKSDIIREFIHLPPIDRPGIAIVINDEDNAAVKCADIFKSDCDDVQFNWFSANINSNTDEEFVKRIIEEFNEMNDVTTLIILKMPAKFKHLKNDLLDKSRSDKYMKLHIAELLKGRGSYTGFRISMLKSTEYLYHKSGR